MHGRVVHDARVRPCFQSAQQFADILGVREILQVEAAEGTHGRKPGECRGGPFSVHLAAHQRLDVGKLEAGGPEGQKCARVSSQRADQDLGFLEDLSDDALFEGTLVAVMRGGCLAGDQLRQTATCQRLGNRFFGSFRHGIERFPGPQASGEEADTGV